MASALASMIVRMLLKSCAMPPVSWPTASIFCACKSCSLVRRWLSTASARMLASTRPVEDHGNDGQQQDQGGDQGGDAREDRIHRPACGIGPVVAKQ